MLKIAICDDIPAHIAVLSDMIRHTLKTISFTIYAYGSAAALMQTELRHDILFLDIQLQGEDGIACAKAINRLSPDTQIIFVTSYLAYAIDVYDAVHTYFLVKPVRPEKLKAALSAAMERVSALQASRILLPLKGGEQRLFSAPEILYFERCVRITNIHSADDGYETVLSLTEISQRLPHGQFARPHNSFLVNLAHVKQTSRTSVFLDSGVELPVSHLKRESFLSALAQSI